MLRSIGIRVEILPIIYQLIFIFTIFKGKLCLVKKRKNGNFYELIIKNLLKFKILQILFDFDLLNVMFICYFYHVFDCHQFVLVPK